MTSAPDLGANYSGAETCHHGANSNGAVVWVQFLEGYYQGRICEKLSKKGQKTKIWQCMAIQQETKFAVKHYLTAINFLSRIDYLTGALVVII
jgi:hypothetical protein